MIKFVTSILSAALLLSPTITVAAPPTASFEHEGINYTYSTVQKKGYRILRGYAGIGKRPFDLMVTDKRVTGTVEGRAVAFRLDEVKPIRGIVTIATR
jgi:hypothetical protein